MHVVHEDDHAGRGYAFATGRTNFITEEDEPSEECLPTPRPTRFVNAAVPSVPGPTSSSKVSPLAKTLFQLRLQDKVNGVLPFHQPGTELGKYRVLRVLAEKNYGHVVLARHVVTKQYVAIKVLLKDRLSSCSLKAAVIGTEIMRGLEHESVVKVIEVVERPAAVCVVMSYCNGGTCVDYVGDMGALGEHEVRFLLVRAFRALAHCYRRGIAHRELKLESILLHSPDNDDVSYSSDRDSSDDDDGARASPPRGSHVSPSCSADMPPLNIGLLAMEATSPPRSLPAVLASSPTSPFLKRLLSSPPPSPRMSIAPHRSGGSSYSSDDLVLYEVELVDFHPFNLAVADVPHVPQVDTWTLGVMAYLLLTTRLPYDTGGSIADMLRNANDGEVDLPVEASLSCHSFLRATLDPDPARRATVWDVLTHPWLHLDVPLYPGDDKTASEWCAEVLKDFGLTVGGQQCPIERGVDDLRAMATIKAEMASARDIALRAARGAHLPGVAGEEDIQRSVAARLRAEVMGTLPPWMRQLLAAADDEIVHTTWTAQESSGDISHAPVDNDVTWTPDGRVLFAFDEHAGNAESSGGAAAAPSMGHSDPHSSPGHLSQGAHARVHEEALGTHTLIMEKAALLRRIVHLPLSVQKRVLQRVDAPPAKEERTTVPVMMVDLDDETRNLVLQKSVSMSSAPHGLELGGGAWS